VPQKFVITFKPGKEMEEKVRELEKRVLGQEGQDNGSPKSAESHAASRANEPPAA
jgi:hypothetical protein